MEPMLPKALTRFLEWGNYVLSRRNSLPARERELAVLRVAWHYRTSIVPVTRSETGKPECA